MLFSIHPKIVSSKTILFFSTRKNFSFVKVYSSKKILFFYWENVLFTMKMDITIVTIIPRLGVFTVLKLNVDFAQKAQRYLHRN